MWGPCEGIHCPCTYTASLELLRYSSTSHHHTSVHRAPRQITSRNTKAFFFSANPNKTKTSLPSHRSIIKYETSQLPAARFQRPHWRRFGPRSSHSIVKLRIHSGPPQSRALPMGQGSRGFQTHARAFLGPCSSQTGQRERQTRRFLKVSPLLLPRYATCPG